MKKSIITITILLGAFCSFCQTIDTAALHLMQKSWDKLNAMENISYRMKTLDTMIRANHMMVNWISLDGTVKKNDYWHVRLENNLEMLVRGDTLYRKEKPDAAVTFSTDWDRHRIGACNIHSILGSERPAIGDNTVSMEFVPDEQNASFYTIHVVYKIKYDSDEIQSLFRYSRYYIDKKSMLPIRRLQYGKSLQDGKEAVDSYDFSAVINPDPHHFNEQDFFQIAPLEEKDRFESLKIGSIAPNFTARDVKTDQVLSLDSFRGKIVVLDFWYLSCMPCRTLMPKLQKLQEKFGKDKVLVIGINVRDTDAKQIQQYLDEKHFSYRQFYQAGQQLSSNYKLVAFPTTFVLDRQGKVKMTEVGLGEDTELKLEQAIKKEL